MKLLFRIIAATLALVLCLGVLAGCASVHKPLFYLKRTLQKAIEQSVGGELASFLLHTLDGGSVAVDFKGTDLTDALVDSAALKVWFDAEDHRVAATGEMVVEGNAYDGALFVNDGHLVLRSPTLFGSTTLGVDFVTLEQDLKNSIFSNKSGTVFAKSEVSESTAKSVNDVKQGLFELLADIDDRIELSDEVLETFLEMLGEQAYNNRYREGGRSYISLSVDNDALARTLRATWEALVKDRSFCREMRKIAATRDAMASARTGVITSEHTTELEYFLSSSSDIDSLCLKIDSAAPFVLELNAKVKNAGDRVESLCMSYTENEETRMEATLLLGREEEESSFVLLLDGVERTFIYQPTKDTFRALEIAFSYKKAQGGETTFSLDGSLSVDRRQKTYELAYEADGVEHSFGGEYAFSLSTFLFSVDSATYDGEEREISFSLTAKRSDKMPATPEYTNLVTIDSKRYAPIDERAKGSIDALRETWEAASPTPYGALKKIFAVLGVEEELPPPPEAQDPSWWQELFDWN